MRIKLWTRRVPASYSYDKLIADAGFQNPKGIVKSNTPLGDGVGVRDAASNAGMLAFRATPNEKGEYIIYYWREI